MTTQPETKQLPTETFQEMDRRDEGQILAEMRGEQLAEYVYSTRIEGRQVTNLSYLGVKEAIRRRGHVEILEIRTEQDDKEFRAIVRVRDQDNQIDVLGASTCEKTKPFAWTLAVNKAERNAWMKLIPSKWIAALISEWISRQGGSNATTTVVTSRSRDQPGITNQPNIPTAATTSPNVRAATGFWTVPRTKDQATPEQAQEGLKQIPLLKGTQSYGMINVSGNQLSLVPEHPIPTDTGII